LARALMAAMLEWCKRERIAKVVLHASQDGRPLYESLGFVQTNEMRWQG
jgi:predicted GNAT family N-acyltransferase